MVTRLFGILALFVLVVQPVAPQSAMLPTEALHRALEALAAGDRAKQQELVTPFLDRARRTDLSPEEDMALGELFFLALNPRDSDALFVKHLGRTDKVGRMAWIRHQQIQFRAFNQTEQTERDIPAFRAKFPVVPEDLTYSSMMVSNQAGRYAAAGNHVKVVELILEDVKGLPLDVPMRSLMLPGSFIQSFVAVNRAEEARTILTNHYKALQALVARVGTGLEPASVIKARPIAHTALALHADWDTAHAEDAPDFSVTRFHAQMALDRIKQLESRGGR